MASTENHLGQVVYGVWNIIPNCPVDTPTVDAVAGEVIGTPTKAAPVFYVVQPHDSADDGLSAGQLVGHFILRKVVGTGKTIAAFDALTFKTVTNKDYFALQKAVTGDKIHAYALEAADATDDRLHVLGPLMPPFTAK